MPGDIQLQQPMPDEDPARVVVLIAAAAAAAMMAVARESVEWLRSRHVH